MEYTIVLKAIGSKGSAVESITSSDSVGTVCVQIVRAMETKTNIEWAVAAIFAGACTPLEGVPADLKA